MPASIQVQLTYWESDSPIASLNRFYLSNRWDSDWPSFGPPESGLRPVSGTRSAFSGPVFGLLDRPRLGC